MRRWCIIVLLDVYPVCSLLRTREKSYPCSTNLAMAKGELGSLAYAYACLCSSRVGLGMILLDVVQACRREPGRHGRGPVGRF